MGLLFDLYRIKVKLFLGTFRASKISAILILVYALGLTPGTTVLSMTIVDSVKGGVDLTVYANLLSAAISGLLALVLLSTFRGFVAFEYEESLVFTSPITPRFFLTASLLSDLTILSPFFYPVFLFLGIVVSSLGLSPLPIVSMALCLILFALFLSFLKTSFSILWSAYGGSRFKALTILLIAILLLPSLGALARLPLSYGSLPYPSTAMAQVVFDFAQNRAPEASSFLLLLAYFLASLALFLFSSEKNLFQLARLVPFVSPFDTSMRVQAIKMGKNIAFFSRMGLRFTLNLRSGSLLRFLMKKEIIRIVRDGSLFTVLVFYGIVSTMFFLGGSRDMPLEVPLFMLLVYASITPPMLISNWRVTELSNLWIPMTSAVGLGYALKPLLYDLTLIAVLVPASVIAVLVAVSGMDPILPLFLITSVSMIGCSVNLYVVTKFLGVKRRATPSLMISWTALLLSGLLMTPVYVLFAVSLFLGLGFEVELLLSIPILLYSTTIFLYFSRKLGKKALEIEL